MFKNLLTLIICLLGVTAWGQLVNDGAKITIQAGATLVVEGSVTNQGATGEIINNGILEVKGNLTHDGLTFSNAAGSKLIFSGDDPSMVALNNKVISVDSLIISKSMNELVTLDANSSFTVNEGIRFGGVNGSHLDLGGSTITLAFGTADITGANENRFFISSGDGELKKDNQSGSFIFPVGKDGSNFSPITITKNGGGTTIGARVFDNVYQEGSTKTNEISTGTVDATWVVSGGGAGELDVEVEWQSGNENGGFDRTNAGIANHTGAYWDLTLDQLDNSSGSDPYSRTRTGVSAGAITVGSTKDVMDYAEVTPQLVLSGPYNGSASAPYMTDVLTADPVDIMPAGEPYAGLTGFTHSGIGGGESATNTNGIVDWVFIEIRDNSNTILGTTSALLKTDGNVVGTDGSQLVIYGLKSGAASPGYHLAVRHRNHLGVLTNGTNKIAASTLQRNSPTAVSFIGGNAIGTDPMRNNGNTVFSLWPGDANGDGKVRYVNNGFPFIPGDGTTILAALSNNPFGQVDGYFSGDINMDGKVRYVNNGFPFIPGDGTTILAALSNNPFGQITQQF